MKNKAFTLIELLVVVLIIGILASIAVPKYQLAVDKSKFVELINFSNFVYNEQEIFNLANGHYASNCEELDISIPGYTLNESKTIFVNQDKRMYITCASIQDGVNPDRVTAYWYVTPPSKNLVAYEHGFNSSPEGRKKFEGKRWCYFGTQGGYNQKVCEAVCARPAKTATSDACYFED